MSFMVHGFKNHADENAAGGEQREDLNHNQDYYGVVVNPSNLGGIQN
jgi:hypothetical protein